MPLTIEELFDARLLTFQVAISHHNPSAEKQDNINAATYVFSDLLILITGKTQSLQGKLFSYGQLLALTEQLAKLVIAKNGFSQDERNFFIAGISYLFQNFSEKNSDPKNYKTSFLAALRMFCPEAFNADQASLAVAHHNIETPTQLAYIKKERHSPQIHAQSSIWFDKKPFIIFYTFCMDQWLRNLAIRISAQTEPRLLLEEDLIEDQQADNAASADTAPEQTATTAELEAARQQQEITARELAMATQQLEVLESTQAELEAMKQQLAALQATLAATQEKITQETQTLAPELTDTSMQCDVPTTTSSSTSTEDSNSHSEDSEDSEIAGIIEKRQKPVAEAAPATPAITIATVASPFNLSHSHCVRDCCIGIRALENFLATQPDNIWAHKIHDRMIHSNTSGLAGGLKIGFNIEDHQKDAHTDLITKITAELEKADGDFSGEYTDKKIAAAAKLLDALSKINISGRHVAINLVFDNKHEAAPKSPRAVASALSALSVTNAHTKATTPTKTYDRPPSRLSHGS